MVLVTDYGLISVFNRSMAGATGIERGTSLSLVRGSGGRHLIAKLDHIARGVRELI